jgi:hypothetical protein
MKSPTKRYIIEDSDHCEHLGTYTSLADAQLELNRLAALPWNEAPNRAPCGSWETCGRNYVLIEGTGYDNEWCEIRRTAIFAIDAQGIRRSK